MGLVPAIICMILAVILNIFLVYYNILNIEINMSSTITFYYRSVFNSKIMIYIMDFIAIVLPFGNMTSQILIVSQTIEMMTFKYADYVINKYLMRFLVSLVIFFPLCLLKSTKQLI